jgi:hypothetical protein
MMRATRQPEAVGTQEAPGAMNYWHLLAEARRALDEDRFRDAETSLAAARIARAADTRRVFLSETLPDGARRVWNRLRGGGGAAGPGRWELAEGDVAAMFGERADSLLRRLDRQFELGLETEPEQAHRLLAAALYLAVDSALVERRPPVTPLVTGLFELLPTVGRLADRDLVRPDLDLDPDARLRIASLARDHLGRLDAAERSAWGATVVALLDHDGGEWTAEQEGTRRWLAAALVDTHAHDVPEIVVRWQRVDAPVAPPAHRHWSRLRRLELLAGCDRRLPPVADHRTARQLADQLPADGDDELANRRRAALAVLDHRRPQAAPDRGWLSAAANGDTVHVVYWWGAEPRDAASWRPADPLPPFADLLAAAEGRVIWSGEAPPPRVPSPDTGADHDAAPWPGRALDPYLEAILEPQLPAEGWHEELARRLALSRSGPWRDGWRSDLGHPDLAPPGQDGRLRPDQAHLETALRAGLLWLAVLGRVDEADPALRAGLAELGRRGHAGAAFLHRAAVLGAPDKSAVDQAFEPWTLPLLWTRPDPLTAMTGSADDTPEQADLAGQDVALVTTGRPGRALAAWGTGQRRWRVVLDTAARLGDLRRQAREAFGPVTVVPPAGEVHHLRSALDLLEAMAADDPDDILAICHWIRLVETHNGDLLDYRAWRPRAAGVCPLHDRYAERVRALPRQPVDVDADGRSGDWRDQYAQRVRRSGLVAGLVDDLPRAPALLDAVWGVFDGSDASWVFLDSAAVHWRLAAHGDAVVQALHALLATRGRRHLSVLGGRGLFGDHLASWLERSLAAYGRPYRLDLGDGVPPRLGLAASGPLTGARLDPVAAWSAPLARLTGADDGIMVRQPADEEAAAFWGHAAAGGFGPAAWRLVAADAPVTAMSAGQLVVPRLASLDLLADRPAPAGDDMPGWRRADAQWAARRLAALEQLSLETAALTASPVSSVEILDNRWWRLSAAPEAEPVEVAAAAGVADADLVALAPADAQVADPVRSWLADRGVVPGMIDGWSGPPLADRRPVAAGGVRLHRTPAALLWRDLAADLLRTWEDGESAPSLLVIASRPPAGTAALVAALGAAAATLPPAGGADGAAAMAGDTMGGPVIWARPDDILGRLERGEALPEVQRILLLDLHRLLPAAGDSALDGARLLGWLSTGAARRVDLVGAPLDAAWSRFITTVLGAEAPEPATAPGGWTDIRRAAGPRPERRCLQCGAEGPAVVDGQVCAGCGQDLAGGAAAPLPDDASRRARGLLAQADLGRPQALEIWGDADDVAQVRAVTLAAGATPAGRDGGAVKLADGRTWRLCTATTGAQSAGPALLLRMPADSSRLFPRAADRTAGGLVLLGDRLDGDRAVGDGARATVDRLVGLLADSRWLDVPARPNDRSPAFPDALPLWRLSWLADAAVAEVARVLDLLRWMGVLTDAVPAGKSASDGPADRVRLRVLVSARDMEMILGDLGARLERTVDAMLAGTVSGGWRAVTAPALTGGQDADPVVARRDAGALDRLLALLALAPGPAAGRFRYRAPGGAWYSDRRLVGRFGPPDELVADLTGQVDAFAAWIRALLATASRVDVGYDVVAPAAGAGDRFRLLMGSELGFWTLAAPAPGPYRRRGELTLLADALRSPAGEPGRDLVRHLADAADRWTRRVTATPPGGALVDDPAPDADGGRPTARPSGAVRNWLRREGRDPLADAVAVAAETLAGEGPGRLVLAGPVGVGRTRVLVEALAGSPEGRRTEIWCPDRPTAVRVHLEARRLHRTWQPLVRVWNPGDPLPQRGGLAPGRRPRLAVVELQRFAAQAGYALQDAVRDGRIIMTVDTSEHVGGWEDLFLTTPRKEEVCRLTVQYLQAQLPWRATFPLLPVGVAEARPHRRQRGAVTARRAGTLDECASAVAAATGSGRVASPLRLVAPMAEDVSLLARALADRRWGAVTAADVDPWLLPGACELAAAIADAHRRLTGRWPGDDEAEGAGRTDNLLPSFLPPRAAEDWDTWLRSLPEPALRDGPGFVQRLARSPWGTACCLTPAAREALVALGGGADLPGDLLPTPVWIAWRALLADLLQRPDVSPAQPAVVLSAADEPAGRLAESLAYVCFGPEPDPVHRRVLSRAADRLLVLYQEHSPLPGEGDADAGG